MLAKSASCWLCAALDVREAFRLLGLRWVGLTGGLMGGDASSGKAGEVRGGVQTGGASSGSGRVRDKGSDAGLLFCSE